NAVVDALSGKSVVALQTQITRDMDKLQLEVILKKIRSNLLGVLTIQPFRTTARSRVSMIRQKVIEGKMIDFSLDKKIFGAIE
ncbi:unnamed protein product, partial [Dovyalis caffra]